MPNAVQFVQKVGERLYYGSSVAFKPPSLELPDTPPTDSKFVETDTGRLYRFDGYAWQALAETRDETLLRDLAETANLMYGELRRLRFGLEAQFDVEFAEPEI